jgi:hypothetical protein
VGWRSKGAGCCDRCRQLLVSRNLENFLISRQHISSSSRRAVPECCLVSYKVVRIKQVPRVTNFLQRISC